MTSNAPPQQRFFAHNDYTRHHWMLMEAMAMMDVHPVATAVEAPV